MKEAGFNALRSAHHPMSKAMLDACDKLGMLVMDELSDMWTRTKNPHDYANYFPTHWKQDAWDMVEKDYNHPCVILYSTGNEIPEAGTPKGAEWNRRIHAEIKRLDATRYTTNGINGLMAGNDRMGEIMCQATGMTPEQLEAMQQPDEQKRGGADEINGMAEVMVGPLADAIATSPILEEMIGEFAAANDIAGYNYLTALHEEDHIRHPNRVVLGTETFPADIVHLWDIVKCNPHVLGDFTWTGYDYLGEAGCGIFHYNGGVNFSAHWPDRLAGIGDIDILGDRKPISYLRQAVFGIGHAPSIGVLRMDKAGIEVGKTPWMWKDNLASWTWTGYEGETASVDVYANADEAELFLNGESLGRKLIGGVYVVTYEVPYHPGKLEAVSYLNGVEAGRTVLQTAGKAVKLKVEADRNELPADGESLTFVKIKLEDAAGNFNRRESAAVTIKVEGCATLQGFGSADPSCEGSYQSHTWNTYDGSVMAVIRAAKCPGKAVVTISAINFAEEKIVLNIK
jgi:Beta-galactosidase/beta-glucuronidase